jgi:hypothetical protein
LHSSLKKREMYVLLVLIFLPMYFLLLFAYL